MHFQQPAAIEEPNDSTLEDDIDDEVPAVPNGTHRSASSSLPRSRTPVGGSAATIVSTQPLRHHQHHHHHSSQTSQASAQTKDTFLNYFFGGQGPASGPSSLISTPPPLPPRGSRSGAAGGGMVGDVDGLALDQDPGKSAAMDMKSLGKHIEAVRYMPFFLLRDSRLLITGSGCVGWMVGVLYLGANELGRDADSAGRDGDVAHSRADFVVLWDRAAEHPRLDPKGDYALPRQLHESTRAEPVGVEPVQARAVRRVAARGRDAGGGAGEGQGAT